MRFVREDGRTDGRTDPWTDDNVTVICVTFFMTFMWPRTDGRSYKCEVKQLFFLKLMFHIKAAIYSVNGQNTE